MRYHLHPLLGLWFAASVMQAQVVTPRLPRVEFRTFTGRYVPLGKHRRDFKSAPVYCVQAALPLGPHMRLVGSTSWTEGESTNIAVRGFPKMWLWQYDAGVEFPVTTLATPQVSVEQFLGVGAGARTYTYPDKGMSSRGYPAGYSAVGAEVHVGHFGLRIEGRAYLSLFRAPLESTPFYRDDALVKVGLVYHVY